MAIGVFDSGLGGMTVWSALNRRLPDIPFIYFADSLHAPYGVREPDDIYHLTCNAIERLWDEGCDLVVLACNTASAVALRRVQEQFLPGHDPDKRVLGVFVPLIEALVERQWGDYSPPRQVRVNEVALFATPSTVTSRAFQRELSFRAIGVDVEAQGCAGLVDAIEDGDMVLAQELVRSHVAALKRRMPNPQVAILGCTHYPLMQDVFQDELGLDVRLYDQAGLVAESLSDYLDRHPDMLGKGDRARFLTSGDPDRVSAQAELFLRRRVQFERA